jgi:mannose-6-phosphate isomerase-like protein (cupin superfamily)
VITGRAKFIVGDNAAIELGPGQLLFFKRNVIHSIPEIMEEPLVFLAVDTPRRDPADVTFVDSTAGDAQTFIRTISTSANGY